MRDLNELNINHGGLPVTRKPPTDEDITKFERAFNVKLPESYIQFLRFSNGGHPELDTYPRPTSEGTYLSAVSEFYHLDTDTGDCEGLWWNTEQWRPVLGAKTIPIGDHGGGDQIYLDLNTDPPRVGLCLHDENFDRRHVADSFEEFLDLLFRDPEAI